ncbi:MAG TPA: winged helix-turn-helix domain-containing protein [Bryobacteraceae bacterium]
MSQRSFGPFDLDLATGELRRNCRRVRLQPLLSRLLVELASRPGELIARDELARKLWPAGLHVDYENSLNNAVARLRRILGSRWIATLPKRGYRFQGARTGGARRRADPAAERAWRRARHFWNRTTIPDLQRAVAASRESIAIDPGYAPAHAGLADACILLGDEILGGMDPRNALAEAEAAARRALEIDGDCAEALAALGMVAWRLHWDWDSAERYLRASIAIQPEYATSRLYYAWLLLARNRRREAEAEVFQAWELDPVSSFVGTNVGWVLYTGRRFSDAIARMRETLVLNEHYAMAHLPLGLSLQHSGRVAEAVPLLAKGVALAGGAAPYYRAALGLALAASDQVAPARKILESSGAFDRAIVHLGFGETGFALDCLEQAVLEGSSHLAYLEADPMFDALRGERRFQRIARNIGLR